jgi:tetratricopeptide (TPR) repeat protein
MSRPPSPFAAAEHLRRLVGDALDEQVAAAAVAAGQVSAADLEAVREQQAAAVGDPPRLTALLRARGLLDDAAIAALEARVAADAFVRPAAAEPPPEARAAANDPERQVGDFVLVRALGRGATGEVWRGWDRPLRRWVALKLSTVAPASGSARERFEREALAAGRLNHPGLVPVYQVGVDRGRPYLVMPLIDGETLETARLPVRRALEVVREAALAMHHAHEQGLVHRDLKPGNVMVDGAGHAHVLDFGLVGLREDAGTQLTQPGDVLGTAGYLSPEQARGDPAARTAATDVYGLGATLYHAVTGKPPFEGASFAAVVAQVVERDPAPPRRLAPALDPRVEAVILRAMDRDAQRRYPSAAALADDLGRILEDRQVLARAPGAAGRTLRVLRRRRDVVVIAVALAAAVAVAFGARLRVRAERRAAVEALRRMARVSLESALALRRAGDLAGMRRLRPALVAAYEDARAHAAETPEVEYLVGRMHRALLEHGDALAHQQRALALDPAFAPALYERAVLLSARYGRLLDAAEAELRLHGGDPAGAGAEAERGRVDIRRDLERLRSAGAARADADAAGGILAYHERRHADAEARLRAVVAADPLREEAWEALARAVEAAHRWSEAESIYGRAIALDLGYLPHGTGRCALRRRMGNIRGAIEDATAVLALEPGYADALLCRGGALTRRAHDETTAGADPSATLDGAAADFDRVLASGDVAAAYAGRAVVHRYRGIFAERRGGDPLPHLAAAERDVERAIALEPERAEHRASRARTRTRAGMIAQAAGTDPLARYDAAEADYAEALRLDRTRPEFWAWRADVRIYRALWRRAHGESPDADLAAADADMGESMRLYSGDPLSYLKRGDLRRVEGEVRAAAGGDPAPLWASAQQDLDVAVHRLGSAEAYVARAELALARADHDRTRRRADTDAAQADVARALAADPAYAKARDLRSRFR